MEASSLLSFSLFLGLNILAALSGAYFRPGPWYRSLAKPRWQPPDRLFAPVWSVLYLLIAFAGWLVFERTGAGPAIAVYVVSLAFNAGWSPIFFGLQRIDWALAWIVLLWLSIVATIVAFWPIAPVAAVLLPPYLAWVSFAAVLNAELWRLNRVPGEATS